MCVCAFADTQVARFFPPDLVRVHYHYLGAGTGRDQSANCVRGESECEGNKGGLCLQHYVTSVPPVTVLGCQAQEPHKVPGNLEACMDRVRARTRRDLPLLAPPCLWSFSRVL